VSSSKDASNQRVAALEKTLSDEESELAAKARALSDLRAEIESLQHSKDASAQQVAEMPSKLTAEEAKLASKSSAVDVLRREALDLDGVDF
jgi:chromosome segregation ATPase